jgi:ABC-type glutathione transport system ATPase component
VAKQPDGPLLEILDLTVTYMSDDVEITALDKVSFNIFEGESIAITGKSGSGKSTLALAIMQMLPANATVRGTIRYRGKDLTTMKESALEQWRGGRISMVVQHPQSALHPLMRAQRQVAEVIRAHQRWPWHRCQQQARAMLQQVFDSDLERISGQYPHQLSGGECQRVCIAQALACHPELLIADEPTAMLDTVVQAAVLRTIHRLCRASNLTLVLITHNHELVPGLAQRSVILEHSGE